MSENPITPIPDMTDDQLRDLLFAQFRHTAHILNDATHYISDSIVDDLNSALDLSSKLLEIFVDQDTEHATDLVTDTSSDNNLLADNYIADGIADEILAFRANALKTAGVTDEQF